MEETSTYNAWPSIIFSEVIGKVFLDLGAEDILAFSEAYGHFLGRFTLAAECPETKGTTLKVYKSGHDPVPI